MKRRNFIWAGALLAAGAGFGVWRLPRKLDDAAFAARYDRPLDPPEGGMSVYHLGHSLVGRDMPVMLDQLVAGHSHASQLGWGASLNQHRQGDVPGFVEENTHASYRAPTEALASGDYEAVVLTEMVEIRDAIRYHDSAEALAHWARAAREGNPDVRVYLYETWHRLDDPEGWLARVDGDLTMAWQDALMRVAMAQKDVGTIYLIPGGQVLAAVIRAIESGKLPGLSRRTELFARDAAGGVDPIHLNDLGAYTIALTHFSTLYHQSPEGLPRALLRADGQPAVPLPDDAALPLQRLVWQVVSRCASTGVAG